MTSPADLTSIRLAAVELLRQLARAPAQEIIAKLRPGDDDFARVFLGGSAEQARAGYASFWASVPEGLAGPEQSEVLVIAAPAESLAADNELSREFPGGYRKVASQFKPGVVWLRFRFVVPGSTTGMSYDGLVYLDDHWAWFPKPWRVLGAAPVDN